jgi:hypothetical protein
MRSEHEPKNARTCIVPPTRSLWRAAFGLALSLALAAGAPAARAGLGGSYASVEADRAHLSASMRSTGGGAYTVHTLTLANHGAVREFTRSDGTVFAIAWRGPGRPDLRQLLGGRFETFQSDNTPPQGRRTRRPLTVNRTDLMVQAAGHPGAFWGFAYLPELAPAGFSTGELK